MSKPIYKHDCDKCTFLGSYNGQDLYHCRQSGRFHTLIARFSDVDSEYTSGLILAGLDEHITEAKKRAEALYLLPYKLKTCEYNTKYIVQPLPAIDQYILVRTDGKGHWCGIMTKDALDFELKRVFEVV